MKDTQIEELYGGKMSNKVDYKEEAKWWAKAGAFALGATIFINGAVVVNAKVPSSSMENTLVPGDRFFANRLAYKTENPKRFDVIVFKYPDDESKLFIKRIIGLPGEKVEVVDGKVYIDGSDFPLEESYIKEPMEGSFGPYEVPEDCYFVMGDNRNNSNDSRMWENSSVHRDKIVGKGLIIYWPPSHAGTID